MARHYQVSVVLAAALLVGGCSSDVVDQTPRLRARVAKLELLLERQEGVRTAELAYLEQQAGLAAGCDWVVPICPNSIVKTGHYAQDELMSGGTSTYFWLAFCLKLFAAGAALGGMYLVVIWGWLHLVGPKAHAAERVQTLARDDDERVKAFARDTEKRTIDAQNRVAIEDAHVASVRATILKETARLEAVRAQLVLEQRSLVAVQVEREAEENQRAITAIFNTN